MFLIKLIRFFQGYVKFVCYGGFPERFINLCSINGIILHNTKTEKNTITATTDIASFKKIKPCVKNSGMKIKITEKGGFPFLLNRVTKRKGLIAGIIASVALIAYLNGFIWITQVKGNDNFTENQILEICRTYGIYPGAEKSEIDVSSVNKQIKNDYENISWFALNIYGSVATLEVSERTDKTNIFDKNTPCNIVSGEDGVIIELITLSGVPAIKTGSAITSGDILISGIIEKTDGSQRFIHARGFAKIRTNKELTSSADRNIQVIRNNPVTRYKLSFFGVNIPLFPADFRADEKYTYSLIFRDHILPVSLTKMTDRGFYSENITVSPVQAKLLAGYNIAMQEKEMMQNAVIEKKDIKVSQNDKNTVLTAAYTIHKTTGIEKFFEVQTE